MARLALIISKSGTGKSSSVRNLAKDEAIVISASGKELPLRSELITYTPKTYTDVYEAIERAKTPIVVIDDANYLMTFEEMARSSETGYGKYTVMAKNMFNVFKAILDKESDQTFYIMAHSDEDSDDLRMKTSGKMLSEKIVLEGLANILITNEVTADGEFVFRVKTDGSGVKTPLGMFDTETVPNDLKIVNEAIVNYYKPAKEAAKK